MTAEINPNMAISMARQFGITVLHNEAEHLVSLFKMWHRTGFENGQALEREACESICVENAALGLAAAIRARGTA